MPDFLRQELKRSCKNEEVGKVAAAVPVIISRALELFVESLIRKTSHVTLAMNAKTLTPAHLKQCIAVENQFDFLKDVVASVPDVQGDDDSSNPPPGDSTPLPQAKLLTNPLKRQRRKFSRNNGDDGAGPSHAASSESEEESDEEDDEDDEDEHRVEDYSSNKSTDFYDVSRTKITIYEFEQCLLTRDGKTGLSWIFLSSASEESDALYSNGYNKYFEYLLYKHKEASVVCSIKMN